MSNVTPTSLETFFMNVIETNGVRLPQRPILDFLGGTVTDDPVGNRTLIQLGGSSPAYANLTASFTMPAVGSNVIATVNNSAGYPTGLEVFIAGAGFMAIVSAPDGTHLTLQNTGGAYNVSPGTVVGGTPQIIPSGPPNLLIQVADAAITARPTLDFHGVTYADDAVNNRAILTVSIPTNTPTRLSSGATLTAPQVNIYANTSGGGFTLTMFGAPTDGTQISFYDDHLTFPANPLVVAANSGQTIMDVNNPIATFGASTTLRQAGGRTRFEWDNTLNRWGIA